MSLDNENLERCLGWLRTHFICPHGNFEFDEEGDCSGDVISCPDCREKFVCREVF